MKDEKQKIISLLFLVAIFFPSLAFSVPPYSTEIRHKILVEKESIYNHILVYYSDRDRLVMGFKSKGAIYTETEVDLQDLTNLTIQYTRLFMATLLFSPEPKNILMIGLGAGAMAQFLQYYYPNINIDLVEIDGDVVDIAKQHFALTETKNTKVHIKDGRVFVKKTKKKYDIVFLDAFRGSFVPFHLKTKEFYEEIKKVLTPNGVFASNLFKKSKLYPYDLQTFGAVFQNLYSFNGDGNSILVAVHNDAIKVNKERILGIAKDLMKKKKFNFDFKYFADAFSPTPIPDKSIKYFTDDFAPVNFFNAVDERNGECFLCKYDTRN